MYRSLFKSLNLKEPSPKALVSLPDFSGRNRFCMQAPSTGIPTDAMRIAEAHNIRNPNTLNTTKKSQHLDLMP